MPLTFAHVEKSPILIMNATGHFTIQDAREMFSHSAEFKKEIGGHMYRISDFTYAESTFTEVLGILRLASNSDLPGSSADPDVSVIVVGDNKWAKLATELLKQPQFHGINIPIFDTQEEAIQYARLHHSLYHNEGN
jgi:hypothetical protein